MEVERLYGEDLERLNGPLGAAAYLRSLVAVPKSVAETVAGIVAEVRSSGDAAVLDYTRRLDTAGAEPRGLLVSPDELDEAIRLLPLEVVAGLQVSIANVAQVAQAGVDQERVVDLPQGQRIVLREIPVRSAAVYVPGGRAPYPSTVVMGVVTARAAGVLDVAVCSPPSQDSEVNAAILGTCRLLGVERVYRMGGAQAIAALAYGTESVQRVDVIVGPGNLYVQEAKHQLSNVVGTDGFAGPSDLLVVLSEDASDREVSLAVLDMLAQAEHGAGSLVGAISPSQTILDAVEREVHKQTSERNQALEPAACVLLQTKNAREAIELANEFAPEHLQLIGTEAESLASSVQFAGCLFVGCPSATAFGDYVAGSNHILPTGGAARFASSLSARHFRRRMPEVRIGGGADKLAGAAIPVAEIEGFKMHAESMRARVREN